jgi:acyl-CoA thioesterase-2
MGDLGVDTALEPVGPATFSCALSPDWEIWGPNGGYLASVAMRAAGIASGRARPASINAHFVGAGRSAPVDISVEVNRETKVATSLTARISQDGRPLLVAAVWGVDDDLEGLEHHTTLGPHDVPDPENLANTASLLGDQDGPPRHRFWDNIEQRPTEWIDDWEHREVSEPTTRAWVRFVPTATFTDPWVDACRSLILIDLDSWPSACRAHLGDLEHFAPTIEVTARFVGSTADEPWLLSEASAPVATGGLIAGSGQIWTRNRQLVALGGSTLLCRPAARRPDR